MDNLVAGHNIAEGCGGSVAVRGVMWSNAHPAPKRWLPLKGSLWHTVARAMRSNMEQLQEASGVNLAAWCTLNSPSFSIALSYSWMGVLSWSKIIRCSRSLQKFGEPAAASDWLCVPKWADRSCSGRNFASWYIWNSPCSSVLGYKKIDLLVVEHMLS